MARANFETVNNQDLPHTALTITQIKSFLPLFIADEGEDRIPLCLWSPPGAGKSDVVAWACEQVKAECRNWMRPSQMDTSEAKGIPDVLNSSTVLRWIPPSWFPLPNGKVCLFFDEIGQGTPAVQAAMMQWILEFQVGENRFPDNCYVIAASNRETDRSEVHKMLAALASRFTHIDLIPDVQAWCDWAFGHDIAPAIIAFIRFRPNYLHKFDANLRSSPNPRGWERLSKIYKKGLAPEVQKALFAGTVGDGAAIEAIAYISLWQKGLPDLDSILMAPKTAPISQSLDVQVAVATGLSAKATANNIGAVIQYTERLGPELDMYAVSGAATRDQAAAGTAQYTGLCNTAAYQQWCVRNQRFHV